jgi:hypothetical protein
MTTAPTNGLDAPLVGADIMSATVAVSSRVKRKRVRTDEQCRYQACSCVRVELHPEGTTGTQIFQKRCRSKFYRMLRRLS